VRAFKDKETAIFRFVRVEVHNALKAVEAVAEGVLVCDRGKAAVEMRSMRVGKGRARKSDQHGTQKRRKGDVPM
jgi:hypothetical protein